MVEIATLIVFAATVARFTNYIRYSTTCPTGITPARWRGMLKWARTNGYL